jgi:hypothetical protein
MLLFLSQMWWYMPRIPATWEVKVRGPQVKASGAKLMKLYLKNKIQTKGTGYGSSSRTLA